MQTGTQVGPYTVDALLGQGGMAQVWRAHHTGLRRFEALKTLPPHLSHDRAFVERFLEEARTAGGLQHQNIAAIHCVSAPDEELPYFAMELVEGGDLADLLAKRGKLPLNEALPILKQVALALDYAGGRGVIHRDVKPANVMLTPDGRVKVVDFGIARAQEGAGGTRLTKAGMIIGTPEYMSPEQSGSGEIVDARTDQYSLGILAYELLCGVPPFKAKADTLPLVVIMQHVRDDVPTPRTFVPDLPQSAVNAILRALAKSPSQRFGSCLEFIEALGGADVAPSAEPTIVTPAPSFPVGPPTVIAPARQTFPAPQTLPPSTKPRLPLAGIAGGLVFLCAVAGLGAVALHNRSGGNITPVATTTPSAEATAAPTVAATAAEKKVAIAPTPIRTTPRHGDPAPTVAPANVDENTPADPANSDNTGEDNAGADPSNTDNTGTDSGEDGPNQSSVQAFLTEWNDASKNTDLDAYCACFAPDVDQFYLKKDVSRAWIRNYVKKGFSHLHFTSMDMSNIAVSMDASDPEQASVELDKTWYSDNSDTGNVFNGSSRTRLDLAWQNGKWQIISLVEPKIYWVKKGKS